MSGMKEVQSYGLKGLGVCERCEATSDSSKRLVRATTKGYSRAETCHERLPATKGGS